MFRLITLSVALFLGKVTMLECQLDDSDYCTRMIGSPANCVMNEFNEAYVCKTLQQLSKDSLNAQQSQKFKLMAFVPQNKYDDCYCGVCPKAQDSMGKCESQGSGKSCVLIQGDYMSEDNNAVTQAWKACMTDYELSTAKTNLVNSGYQNIDSTRFAISDPTMLKKPYTCISNFKFYVKKTGQCNNLRFGMDSEVGIDELTEPIDYSATCNGVSVTKGTQDDDIDITLKSEQGCIIKLSGDGTQTKTTFTLYGKQNSLKNLVYFRDRDDTWNPMDIDDQLIIDAKEKKDYTLLIMNTDTAADMIKIKYSLSQDADADVGSGSGGGSNGLYLVVSMAALAMSVLGLLI
ncbi:UNKNOWN [Stylonychia lemnae]|uniref:Uncharacterized protein n=1 Tax=Stylonychia lemnae TaxID=5949 RepID=A0A078A0L9_STYLE|nr:UNKNOWN [Stylonychia lemnae]|eukprot:CDW75751.1 UNKNOWN [Stylonychia lemnae]